LTVCALQRAAAFAAPHCCFFHQDAEKLAPRAYVKIGQFANDTDLAYQHEVHGSLISLPGKVMDVIYLNYFKGIVSYNGIQRIETHPVPHAAFREAITNAIVHRDYGTDMPIQI
jgi:ATP-dependent DNA helicase RecG